MNQCDFCYSKPTCFDEPREDCPYFRPNDEYRRNRIEEQVKEHNKRIRVATIEECLELVDKIMPPQPNLLKFPKHYEDWKMKTTELRMLRDMLEQLKEKNNE